MPQPIHLERRPPAAQPVHLERRPQAEVERPPSKPHPRSALTLPFLAALLALSCSRCPSEPAPDAGSLRQAHPTDVRTALMTIYPEYRGSIWSAGQVMLTRELNFPSPPGQTLEQALAPAVLAKGFFPPDGAGGGLIWVRPPFALLAEARGGRVLLSLTLPLLAEDLERLFQSPAPLSSELMATYLPMPSGARQVSESFALSIDYRAREERTDFLVRQLVDLLIAGHWSVSPLPEGWEPSRRPDGGVGGVPPKFQLNLSRAQPVAKILLERDGPRVHLELVQPTWP